MRRSEADWRELIEECNASGLTAAEFCRRNGLNAKYFSLQKAKLKNANKAFVAVQPATVREVRPSTVKLRIVELDVSLNELSSVLASLRC